MRARTARGSLMLVRAVQCSLKPKKSHSELKTLYNAICLQYLENKLTQNIWGKTVRSFVWYNIRSKLIIFQNIWLRSCERHGYYFWVVIWPASCWTFKTYFFFSKNVNAAQNNIYGNSVLILLPIWFWTTWYSRNMRDYFGLSDRIKTLKALAELVFVEDGKVIYMTIAYWLLRDEPRWLKVLTDTGVYNMTFK